MYPTEIEPSTLVDIRTVKVTGNLSKEQRIAEYVRQIKNPYLFKCGKYTISVKHTENGPTLEECLCQMMS
ncbi:MAG: hypothetical protein FWC91_07595 [Defluviitaleaceae bacterium]|nr:hypothetical protein [Defluviitaleaceae bacterium]